MFTEECTAVGKTNVPMCIVLSSDVKPVLSHDRKIKPHLEQSFHDQLNSWLHDEVIAPAISPYGAVLLSQWQKWMAPLDGL